jgi:hypothetical protein
VLHKALTGCVFVVTFVWNKNSVMKTTRIITLTLLAMVFTTSCRKELQESLQSAQDNAQIETEYAQLYEVVTDYAANDVRTGKTDDYILPSGAVVTFTDTTFDDGDGVDFYINYGPLDHGANYKGILCKDGRYRAGVVHVGLTDHWSSTPCILTIAISSADNYYVGNGTKMYKLTGTKEVNRTSATSYAVTVTDASLQTDNGTAYWEATRNITQTHDAGQGWLNDEYTISGSATGTNANGVTFTAQTITPLVKKLSIGCLSTFVAGELVITNSNGKVLSVDYDVYGNQECDKTVNITYNGKTRTITLW